MNLLAQEGFDLSPDRVLRIEHALLNMPFDPAQDPVGKLELYLAPLVAQDESSQERFYALFKVWADSLVPKEDSAPVPRNNEVEQRKRRERRAIGLIASAIALLVVGLAVWLMWPKPVPPRQTAAFSADSTCLAVGSEVQLRYLSPDTTATFRWDFGDGQSDTTTLNPIHRYREPGEYIISLNLLEPGREDTATQFIYVRPEGPAPRADFRIDSLGDNRYRLVPLSPDTLAFTYTWGLGKGESDKPDALEPLVRFEPNQLHYLSLTVGVKGAGDACAVKTTQRLDLRKELITLAPALSARMEDVRSTNWTLLAWFLPLALVLLGWLGWRAYRLWQRRLPGGPTLSEALDPGNGPPIFLDFADTAALPVANDTFHAVANRMKQRSESETERIDLSATLRATIRNAGFPEFRYQRPSRATEFLALVQTQGEEDQQARLFTRYLQRLQAEQVVVDIWYFTEDLRACFRPGGERASLSRLLDTYCNARLLVYGDASTLLAPFSFEVLPGLERLLAGWEHKAWFTPQPPADWGRAERQAARMFLLLPADLNGQLESQDAWQEQQDFDFRALQRHFMRQERFDALSDYDFLRVADLKAWLGEERFQWLAATALYPRPVWEITLAMGMALSPGSAGFDDLLRLTSIPWLQNGDLSETLRAELVAELSSANEQTAREVLRDLLRRTDPPEQSFAAQEKAIQLTVQEAFLQPGDPGKQEALRLLWEQGLLDPLPRLHLRREQAAREARQRRSLRLAAAWTLGLLLLGWLAMGLGGSPAGNAWQTLGLVQERPADSLAWYVNATAKALDEEDTLAASTFAAKASALAPEQPEVRYHLLALDYLRGRLRYQRWQFAAAEPWFDRAASAATEGLELNLPGYEALPGGRDETRPDATYLLFQHSLHGLGLSRYYNRNTAGAEAIRDQMDPAYFRAYSPNLLTLLGGKALRQQVAEALREADSLYTLLWPGLKEARVLEETTETDLRRIREAYERVLALEAENARALARLEELRVLRAGLLPTYELNGQVLDDSTGQPLAGVQVDWWDGQGQTDASGRFLLKVQEEDGGSGRVVLALQNDGYEPLTTEARLPSGGLSLRMKRLPPVPDQPDMEALHLALDLALKQSRCAEVDSLLALLDAANAPDIYDYRQQREEVCGKQQEVPIIPPEMVRVPGGTFQMGSEDYDDEKPVHPVTVSDFYLGRYEVTNAEYAAFLNAKGNQEEGGTTWYNAEGEGYNGYAAAAIRQEGGRWVVEAERANHPVNYVSWYGARAYAAWLSEQTGQNWRLPTEAEWEYAAGGGLADRNPDGTRKFEYAGSNTLDEVAWYTNNTNDTGTRPVGTKKANGLGLYDMSGNVFEWCADWYGENYYATLDKRNPTQNPKGPISGISRVLRGGSWNGYVNHCRVSDRNYNLPDYWYYSLGFRLARD